MSRSTSLLATTALAALLAGCGVLNVDKPLLADEKSEVQPFPLFPDNNRDAPLWPSDAVQDEAAAIRIAMNNCGDAADDPAHWTAERDGEVWRVTFRNARDRIDAQVWKSDGTIAACEIDNQTGH
jgi:hypothetical protein